MRIHRRTEEPAYDLTITALPFFLPLLQNEFPLAFYSSHEIPVINLARDDNDFIKYTPNT